MNSNNKREMQPDVGLTLRMCALCPSPCRDAWPALSKAPLESELPSGLALLAMAVLDGHIALDDEVRASLHVKPEAELCAQACVYHLSVVTGVRQVLGNAGGSAS